VYLGIDLGTSSVKAVLVEDSGRIGAIASSALTLQRPHPLWSEQDPSAWWQATVEAIHELPADLRRAVRGIGLCGQMHGAVLLGENDRPLRPAILWNDGRSQAQCEELERREPHSREITGNLAMPGFTAPKLLWVCEHEPENFRRTRTVLLPKDYLRLQLTGDKISDMSDSSGTLWLDVARRAWSDAMLTATGLSRAAMPALVEGSAPAGQLRKEVAALLGLPPARVAGGAGDNAATAMGCGILDPGQAFLSLGTSGVLFVVTDRFRPKTEHAVHAFCHALPGSWHQMSVMLSAASAVDWAVASFGFKDVVSAVQAASERGLQAATPLFLPYLSGERTPHNDPLARGAFVGLSAETSPADLMVAVLEGVALGFADGLEALTDAGSAIAELVAVGGGSRLRYWRELLAAALNLPVGWSPGSEHAAALGAAHLGRLAATGADPHTIPVRLTEQSTSRPDARLADLLDRRRRLFTTLYRQLKPVYREFAL
jgi:xylulokinase